MCPINILLLIFINFRTVFGDVECRLRRGELKSVLKYKDCETMKTVYIARDKLDHQIIVKSGGVMYNNHIYPQGRYSLNETSHEDKYVLKLCHERGFCTTAKRLDRGDTCLKKCCPHGESLKRNRLGKVECANSHGNSINITSYTSDIFRANISDVALFYDRMDCPKYIANYTKHKFYFARNGSIFMEEKGHFREYPTNQQKYCLESYRGRSEVFVCASSNANQTKFMYSRPIMVFSCICLLLATLRFMFCFKTMRLMQLMLVFFCGSQFVSFAIITFLQFGLLTPNKAGCRFVGFLHLFATLAAFLWLNVISFSLWKTLRSMSARTNEETSVRRKFLFYSCYVWCVAVTITVICYFDNSYDILPSEYHPYLGKTRCILEHSFKDVNYGYIIYFSVPTGAIIVTNMIFFGFTIGYIVNVKVSIVRTGTVRNGVQTQSPTISHEAFKVALKLFVIMGCTWLFEIVSTLYDFKRSYVLERTEVVLDTINSLQGFFLLLIFDFKELVHLFSFCKGKRQEQRSSGTAISF